MADDLGFQADTDLVAKYFPPEAHATAVKIMQAESGGNPSAVNKNTNGTTDHGLFQINDVNVAKLQKAGVIKSKQDLYDPDVNAKAAGFLYKQEGTKPWNSSKKVWGGKQDDLGFVADVGFEEDKKAPTQPAAQTLGSKLGARASEIGKTFKTTGAGTQAGFAETALAPVHMAGQAAGMVGDVLGSAASMAYETLVPRGARESIRAFGEDATAPGTPAGEILGAVKKAYGAAEKQFPLATRTVEDVANIAAAVPIAEGVKAGFGLAKGAAGLVKEGAGALSKAGTKAAEERIAALSAAEKVKVHQALNAKLSQTVEKGMTGTIGTTGKTATRNVEEVAKRTQAVETLLKDPELKLTDPYTGEPVNLAKNASAFTTSQAIEQAKFNLWNKKIEPALAAVEGAGAKISVKPSLEGLQGIINDETLIGSSGESVKKQAAKLMKDLKTIEARGGYGGREAQKFITDTNRKIKAYMEKVNPELDSELGMRASIATDLRKGLDAAIEKAQGAGVQEAKKQYGSLLSIEADMNKLRNKQMRVATNANIPTHWDMATDWGVVHGVLAANPSGALSAGVVKGLVKWRNMMINPDNRLKKMFKEADSIIKRRDMVSGAMTTPTPRTSYKGPTGQTMSEAKKVPIEQLRQEAAQAEESLKQIREKQRTGAWYE